MDGNLFPGPMRPTSAAGNTWVVGQENHIYHSGTTFDPTGGVPTQWHKVLANASNDGFFVGSAAAGFPTKNAFQPTGSGPILAEFTGANNRMIYATYLSSLGFTAPPFMARDKGGNIYLAQCNLLVKRTSSVPQKVAYTKHLNYCVDSIAVDQYSQVYLEAGSSGIPIVNSPQSTPGGSADTSIVVLSPKADRVVYSSYLGGDQKTDAGVDVDSAGNAHLGGVELNFIWDGRSFCPDGANNCQPLEYYATFGPLNRSSVPAKLNFAKRTVGSATTLNALYKATGNVPSTVAGFTPSGSSAFAVTNSCTAAVKPDATCMLVATFKPTSTGVATATLSVHSDSLDSPQLIQLTGTGK